MQDGSQKPSNFRSSIIIYCNKHLEIWKTAGLQTEDMNQPRLGMPVLHIPRLVDSWQKRQCLCKEFLVIKLWGWDGSAAKSTSCSCKEPEFSSQGHVGGLTTTCNSGSNGIWHPLLASKGKYTQKHTHRQHINRVLLLLFGMYPDISRLEDDEAGPLPHIQQPVQTQTDAPEL